MIKIFCTCMVFVVGIMVGAAITEPHVTQTKPAATTLVSSEKPSPLGMPVAGGVLSEKSMDMVTEETSEAGMPATPNLLVPKISTKDSCAVANTVTDEGTPSIVIDDCKKF